MQCQTMDLETRMKIVDMTATGDDNVLSPEEKGDLEYCKQQLKDVWMSQTAIAQMYNTTPQNITMHIRNIYEDSELDENVLNSF